MIPAAWFSSNPGCSPTPSSATQRKKEQRKTIKAVVVHSHSGGKRVWDYLGRHWNEFGDTKLMITQQREFTLESLVKASPDVIVCSDPAGAPYQYTAQEVADIHTYLTRGVCRHLLGTYATFFHQEGSPSMPHIYDNRRLASLFGLNPAVAYTTRKLPTQPKYEIMPESKNSCLWKDVGSPYCTWGYNSTQIPVANDGQWIGPKEGSPSSSCPTTLHPTLPGADVRVLAKTSDNLCVIINFVTDSYSSLYISHMPEYESLRKTKADVQFLYNSFLFLANQGNCLSLASRCIDVVSRSLSNKALYENMSIPLVPSELQERIIEAARLSGKADERRLRDLFGPMCRCVSIDSAITSALVVEE